MDTYQRIRFLSLFLFSLFSTTSGAQNCPLGQEFVPCIPFNSSHFTCYPSGDPGCGVIGDPIVDETCWGHKDIKPYLARTVVMTALWRDIWENDWNTELNQAPTYDEARYCEEIDMLVDLKAMFITRAVNYWEDDVWLFKWQCVWDKIGQVVVDINKAYDCAGLRRPIIQAGFWETMSPLVSDIKIPDCVLDEFINDPDFDPTHYQSGVYFNAGNIVFANDTDLTGSPDITRIEARMWNYFLAKHFIDRGYKALWLGQRPKWGANDIDSYHQNGDMFYTMQMVDRIRDYAESQNTFVILNVEEGDVLRPNTNEQLFDMGMAAMRPREIFLDDEGNKVNVDNYKGDPANNFNDQNDTYDDLVCGIGGVYDEKMYDGTFCEGKNQLAFIDNCHGTFNVATSSGGVSPKECEWGYGETPTLFYWDNGPGCYDKFAPGEWLPKGTLGEYYTLLKKNPDCGVDACDSSGDAPCDSNNYEDCKAADPHKSKHGVWGWDDLHWWVYGLEETGMGTQNDACRLDWMKINFERVRNFSDGGNSFLTIMGRKNVGCIDSNHNEYPNAPKDVYRLSENPVLLNGLIDFMTPTPITEDDIIVTSKCTNEIILEDCGTINICGEDITVDSKIKEYTFTVNNPSPTSIYSWHFQKEDGTWLPKSFGKERKLYVSEDITLEVSLRQDDFGLANINGVSNPYGVKQVTLEEPMTLTPCCTDEVAQNATAVFYVVDGLEIDGVYNNFYCHENIRLNGNNSQHYNHRAYTWWRRPIPPVGSNPIPWTAPGNWQGNLISGPTSHMGITSITDQAIVKGKPLEGGFEYRVKLTVSNDCESSVSFREFRVLDVEEDASFEYNIANGYLITNPNSNPTNSTHRWKLFGESPDGNIDLNNPLSNSVSSVNAVFSNLPSIPYYIRHGIKRDGCEWEWTNLKVQFRFDNELLALHKSIRVFPNPINSASTVQVEVEGNIQQIELFDISGKQIGIKINEIGTNQSNFTINETISSGVYVVRVLTEDNNLLIDKLVIE